MDLDATASTWIPSPRPAMTLTFDLQNVMRSSVYGLVVIHCKFHRDGSSCSRDMVVKRSVCMDERTDGQTDERRGRTTRNIMSSPTMSGAEGVKRQNQSTARSFCVNLYVYTQIISLFSFMPMI